MRTSCRSKATRIGRPVEVVVLEDQAPTTKKVVPDNSVPDRYYTGEEHQDLNDAQKKGLDLKRAKRGHKSKVKQGRTSGGGGGNKFKMEL